MHTFIECFHSAWLSIRSHGLRSLLTTLGIIIGVASVIATISLVHGLSRSIGAQFDGLGATTLTVESYTTLDDAFDGNISRLRDEDLQTIALRVDGIDSITPEQNMVTNKQVVYRTRSEFSRVLGTRRDYKNIRNLFVKHGRFITDSDEKTRRRVCVIGEDLRKDLSLPENPVGKFIQVNGEWLKIVGLMEPLGKLFGFSQDDYVLLPYNTVRSINGNQFETDIRILLNVESLDVLESVKEKIIRVLRKSRGLSGDSENDFKVQTSEQLKSSISKITNMITVVMSGIVGISLLVGGIGIMNIMLVSVTERTREIGICKAIGATRNTVLLQFLIESVLLSIFGGLVGLALGYALGSLVSMSIPGFPAAVVPVWAIVLAFASCVSIGIVFGILPAAKASNLDPIDALRYE